MGAKIDVEGGYIKAKAPEGGLRGAHFFFDIGKGAKLAFFYYFGEPKYEDPNLSQMLSKARHLSIHVESRDVLEQIVERVQAAGYELRHRGVVVEHEFIESVYMYDPNGYNIEFSAPLRPLYLGDERDANLSIQALIDVASQPDPSLQKVWARKGELIAVAD